MKLICLLAFLSLLALSPILQAQESILLESAEDAIVDAPVNQLAPINFRNNFDTDNIPFSADCDPSEGQCAYGIFNNALEIQASVNEEQLGLNDAFVTGTISFQNRTDSFGVNAAISSRSRSNINGFAAVALTGTLYNDTEAGGINGGRGGDVEARIRIDAFPDGANRILAELIRRPAQGGTERLSVFNGENRFFFDIDVQLDTTYILDIEFDRDNSQITFSVGGEEFETIVETISIATPILIPSRNNQFIQAGLFGLRSPLIGRGIGRVSEIRAGGTSYNFTGSAPLLAYQFENAGQNQIPASTFRFDNGQIMLTHDSTIQNRGDARLVHEGTTDYVEVTFEITSESNFVSGGTINTRISATPFRDITGNFSVFDETGIVFADLRMEINGTNDFVFLTCAFRSNNSNNSEGSELIAMNPNFNDPNLSLNCRRFALTPQLDTQYTGSVALNREARTMTFRVQQTNDESVSEEFVFDLPGDVFPLTRNFAGIRTQSRGGSNVVALVDSMAFAPEDSSVPLEASSVLITRDISTAVNAGSNATNLIGAGANTTPDINTPPVVNTVPDIPSSPDTGTTPVIDNNSGVDTEADTSPLPETDNSPAVEIDPTELTGNTDATAENVLDELAVSSGVSGGGCSIGNGDPDPLLPLLVTISTLFMFLRRRTEDTETMRLCC